MFPAHTWNRSITVPTNRARSRAKEATGVASKVRKGPGSIYRLTTRDSWSRRPTSWLTSRLMATDITATDRRPIMLQTGRSAGEEQLAVTS